MGPHSESIHLRADPGELRAMREFVSGWAARTGLEEDDTFSACLVATEAVTNAIRHGGHGSADGRPITVTCTLDGPELVLEVTDRGRFRSERERGEDNGGRGLFLIRELTRRFDLQAGQDGTHLCMRLSAHGRVLAGSQAA